MADAIVLKDGNFSLEYSSDGGTTYTVIPNVTSFDPGQIESEEKDITSFSSTGAFREFKQGFKSAADGSFTVNYLTENTVHNFLRDRVGGAAIKLRGTITEDSGDDEIMVMDVLVKAQSKPIEIDNVLTSTFNIRMTGQPTYSTS